LSIKINYKHFVQCRNDHLKSLLHVRGTTVKYPLQQKPTVLLKYYSNGNYCYYRETYINEHGIFFKQSKTLSGSFCHCFIYCFSD